MAHRIVKFKGAWVAQSVGRPTLGFHSGHDLKTCGFQPCYSCATTAQSLEPASDSVSLPRPALPLAYALSLSRINKTFKKNFLNDTPKTIELYTLNG